MARSVPPRNAGISWADAGEFFIEVRVRLVPLGKGSNRQRPVDRHGRVPRVDCAFGGGRVSAGVQVEQLAVFGQGLESMCESAWNHEARQILAGQHLAVPAQKSRGTASKIDRDIEHLATKTADHLD